MDAIIELATTYPLIVGLVVGALTPLVTAVVEQPDASRNVRTVIALLTSGVAGAFTVWMTGVSDPADMVGIVGLVVVASEAFYQKVWGDGGLATRIELGTSSGRHRPENVTRSHDGQ